MVLPNNSVKNGIMAPLAESQLKELVTSEGIRG